MSGCVTEFEDETSLDGRKQQQREIDAENESDAAEQCLTQSQRRSAARRRGGGGRGVIREERRGGGGGGGAEGEAGAAGRRSNDAAEEISFDTEDADEAQRRHPNEDENPKLKPGRKLP